MKLEDSIVASEDIVAREVGGETVLLDLEAGTYFGLNAVGGRIWQMLEGSSLQLSQVCDQLEGEFAVERATLETDVLALVSDMMANNLVKRA